MIDIYQLHSNSWPALLIRRPIWRGQGRGLQLPVEHHYRHHQHQVHHRQGTPDLPDLEQDIVMDIITVYK